MASSASAAAPGPQNEVFEDCNEDFDPSLARLIESDTLQWIFVGGKGGVGKTTTACSLAVELAGRRDSVLLLSTDPAHNISDAFCQKFTSVPTLVKGFENLHAMEIDASLNEGMEFRLKKQDALGKVMQELVSAFPGVDEAMGFAEIMQNVQSMPYSVIVFDTAPTGHTLRLLGFPDLLERGLSKFGTLHNKFGGMLQMLGSLSDQGEDEEELAQKVTGLRSASSGVRDIFQDPERCTFVCVCIPEFLSVYETERLIQELCKHGIDSSNIVVNQVLFAEDCGGSAESDAAADSGKAPEAPASDDVGAAELETLAAQIRALPLPTEQTAGLASLAQRAASRVRDLEKGWDVCQKKRRMQSKYLSQINDLYRDDFHIVPVPMLGDEVRGLERLRAFAKLLRESGRSLPISAD